MFLTADSELHSISNRVTKNQRVSSDFESGGQEFESLRARHFGKTANATSRRFYASGGDKCPEQFGFRAKDTNLARTDDLNALGHGTQMVPPVCSIFVSQLPRARSARTR
jgi:hypothetical protein